MTQFTHQQQAVLDWAARPQGNLLIEAVPGAGKSFIMLKMSEAWRGKRVLMTAFSSEIAKRNEAELKAMGLEHQSPTLHSIGYAILRHWNVSQGSRRNFRVEAKKTMYALLDLTDKYEDYKSHRDGVIARAKSEKWRNVPSPALPKPELPPRWNYGVKLAIVDVANEARNNGVSPMDYESIARIADDLEIRRLRGYEALVGAVMQRCDEMFEERTTDFIDMLTKPVQHNMTLPEPFRDLDVLMVDEVQDFSPQMWHLAMKLKGERTHVVMGGDENQAIFSFNNATVQVMRRWMMMLQPTRIQLTYSFRCAKAHTALAAEYFPGIEAAPANQPGTIQRISMEDMERMIRPGDFLYARRVIDLIKATIPFLKTGRKVQIHLTDDPLNRRVQRVAEDAERTSTHSDIREALVEYAQIIRVEQQMKGTPDHLAERRNMLIEGVIEIAWALGLATASEIIDTMDRLCTATPDPDAIVIKTVHQVKGKEATRCFYINDGKPYINSRMTEDDIAEERRVHYVALTRSTRDLFFVEEQPSYQRKLVIRDDPFLEDITI